MTSGDNTHPIDVTGKKLNHQYEKVKNKNEEKRKKESNKDAISAVSMVTNLVCPENKK